MERGEFRLICDRNDGALPPPLWGRVGERGEVYR
jgi:hypothetical protein